MNASRKKGQLSFFAKTIFIVISSIAFVVFILLFSKYQKETQAIKESSQFRMDALNILQKLVTSPDCLASSGETAKKVVLDKKKLDELSQIYSETEPKCAKALNFDYNITVIQLEKHTTLYPGKIIITGEPTYVNALAFHEAKHDSNHVYYGLCNFQPDDKYCSGELDGFTDCPEFCWYNLSLCPVGKYNPCCVTYICPIEKCEIKENKLGDHPRVVMCDVDLKRDCKVFTGFIHRWCGKVAIDMPIEVGEKRESDIERKEWSFGVKTHIGISSYSPRKAKKEELTISIPVIIKYNETFSTEGFIYFHAVRGELEELYSLLEDLCEKAESGITLNFSKNFHLSYPVKYSEPYICMTDSCKKFECSYSLDFEEISVGGDYSLKFSINPENKRIVVRK
jgi:hypothetical protein